MYTSSFLCTKPRLSQARVLLFPKVFVPLGIKKNRIVEEQLKQEMEKFLSEISMEQ
nr:MAG TPA: hypothetical protein [Caudoviricetes sp.]